MKYQTKILNKPLTNNAYLIPQPRNAWSIILGFVFITSICLLIGISSILQFLFPLGVLVIGFFLYKQYSQLYIGFTWWIWFLSPLIARIVEYQNGWADPSLRLIILSPYLVTAISGITFVRYIPQTYKKDGLPFFLAFFAVLYALFIGLILKNSATVAIEGFLSWMPGILFGFHLLINWRNYPEYKRVIKTTFLWGILIMGTYGLIQYFSLPPWDKFWIDNAEEIRGSVGWDEIRIWSTLNTPIAFANAIIVGILLLLSDREKWSTPISAIGFICLLLARVRSSWVGFIVGLFTAFVSLQSKIQMKFLGGILALVLCTSPLIFVDAFSERIIPRLATLTNLQEDSSVNARLERYSELQEETIFNVVGSGLGTRQVDAGAFAVLDTLGWLGIIPYMGGLLLLIIKSFKFTEAGFDPFVNASRSISLSILVMTLGNNMLVRFYGVVLWGFLGIAFAAHKYYQHQKLLKYDNSV